MYMCSPGGYGVALPSPAVPLLPVQPQEHQLTPAVSDAPRPVDMSHTQQAPHTYVVVVAVQAVCHRSAVGTSRIPIMLLCIFATDVNVLQLHMCCRHTDAGC